MASLCTYLNSMLLKGSFIKFGEYYDCHYKYSSNEYLMIKDNIITYDMYDHSCDNSKDYVINNQTDLNAFIQEFQFLFKI